MLHFSQKISFNSSFLVNNLKQSSIVIFSRFPFVVSIMLLYDEWFNNKFILFLFISFVAISLFHSITIT